MKRVAVAASLLALSGSARAQNTAPALPPQPGASVPADAAVQPPAAAGTTTSVTDLEKLKKEWLEQARRDGEERTERLKDELRNEVRAELATQSASRAWDDEWQEQKKKLELLELDGYLRVRPTLFHDMDLARGPDVNGNTLYPRPVNDPDPTKARTLSWADTRVRIDPTLNLSEDIRLRGQVDLLDNLVLGSTSQLDGRTPIPFLSWNQLSPQSGVNGPLNAIRVKRAWAEVNTPIGLLSFGRMGNHWGLGVVHNDGNGLDNDFGDTVDRIQFAAKLAGFYLVPMIDFVGKGPTTFSQQVSGGFTGQPVDRDQADDVSGPISLPVLSVAVARKDTEKELQRRVDAGEMVLNYGAYFTYRYQRSQTVDTAGGAVSIPRDAQVYSPDVWFKLATKRFRLEAELGGHFGSIGNRALVPTSDPTQNQSLSILQVGGAVQGAYKLLEGQLQITGEVGFASGDPAAGMGNRDAMGNATYPNGGTAAGSIDGPQFDCTSLSCKDAAITNFRFNRDYRVDLILWREILQGVTDAVYVKPGVKYEIADGFNVFLNVIYSRALYAASTPGNDANLGVEFDPGVSYVSDDGFTASFVYGGLIPLQGLSAGPNAFNGQRSLDASVAHALRGTLAIKF